MYPIQWDAGIYGTREEIAKEVWGDLLVDNKWLLMEPFINAELSNAILFHLALHLAVYSHDF